MFPGNASCLLLRVKWQFTDDLIGKLHCCFYIHRLGKLYIRASSVIATRVGQLHNKDLLRLLMGFPSS